MDWVKDGVNYWENDNCPKEYLEGALVRLVHEVEGVVLPVDYFREYERERLIKEISFYEYVSDK